MSRSGKGSNKKAMTSQDSDDTPKSKKGNNKSVTSQNNEDTGSKSAQTKIYRYNKLNLDAYAEVSELNKEGQQPLAYINYNDPDLNSPTKILVQTDKIKITSHGIPSLSKEGDKNNYYPTDDKREFIKVPLDPEQESCVKLRKFLEKVDEWAGSEEMRIKLFGKRASKYQYQKCIKSPEAKDDDEDDGDDDDKPKKGKKAKKSGDEKKKYPPMDYVKMKLNVVGSGSGRINVTKLKRIEGSKKTFVKADTVTEVANEIRFLSEIKIIFYFNKIWANKTVAQGATVIPYGMGFKVIAFEYTPHVGKGVNTDEVDFISEEEEEDDDQEQVQTKKSSKAKNSPKMDDDENENDDNEDEEDEDDSKKNSKNKNKSETSSKNKKSSKKTDDDDDEGDDEDDDVPVTKAGKKNEKKKSKKSKKDEDDEENEEDEEDIKPKKKREKGKSSSKGK